MNKLTQKEFYILKHILRSGFVQRIDVWAFHSLSRKNLIKKNSCGNIYLTEKGKTFAKRKRAINCV